MRPIPAVVVRWHLRGFSAELIITELAPEETVLIVWPAEGWMGRARLKDGRVLWDDTVGHDAMFDTDLDAILELLNDHKDALPWGGAK